MSQWKDKLYESTDSDETPTKRRVGLSSFIRKKLKLRGYTEHSGRGFYHCAVEGKSQSDLHAMIRTACERWKAEGVVESIETRDNGTLWVEFPADPFGRYRGLAVSNGGSDPFLAAMRGGEITKASTVDEESEFRVYMIWDL